MRIDLNCDLGEGCAFDADLMPLITSANVACGGHVDLAFMGPALRLAKEHGVQVGAHPSFADPDHFGRRELDLPSDEVFRSVLTQLQVFLSAAEEVGVVARYVKPHGALYNMACRSDRLAEPLIRLACDLELPLMALPGSRIEALCAASRVPFVAEGFADRRYRPDGSLVPRTQPDAFVEDPDEAVRQAEWLIRERGVQTLCVHGDNPQALVFVRTLRQALTERGFTIAPFAVS
jgi:5-oxoprolinase (ATP-hydrolysing) subunit A